MQKSLKIDLRPDTYMIGKVKRKTVEFLKSQDFSDDVIRSQMDIIQELFRNAIKCSQFTKSENKMTIKVFVDTDTITVELKNPVDDSSNRHLKELDETIQWIRGYQDPFEAYMIKMHECHAGSQCPDICGLDLARIAYEGNALLDFFVSEENILNISAISSYSDIA